MAEKKSNAGRKSKYETHVVPRFEEIREWCAKGYTEAEMYKILGIGKDTWYKYKREHVEFADILKTGKVDADDLVEQALYKNAMGYFYTEETVTNKGDVVEVKKYHKGNTTAQIFWLKNRRRDEWRDKQEVEHSGGMDIEVNLDGLMDGIVTPNADNQDAPNDERLTEMYTKDSE